MLEPMVPLDEARRLAALRSLGLLDTRAEERFDRITRLAQRLFGVPIALVSLVDEERQWFKSHQGLETRETSRASSFCAHAIHGPEVFQVTDASLDSRFVDNPLVTGEPNIRFYAGAPIAGPDGSRLGTLCVIDRTPRVLSESDVHALEDLAEMVEQEIAAVHLAISDELTGLSNRRGFHFLGQKVLELCVRQGIGAVLVYVDMDNLKQINDQMGHGAGDRAIRAVADALASVFRSSDVISRLGGDEFAVLLSGASEADEALSRLFDELDGQGPESDPMVHLSVSAGTAAFDPAAPVPLDELLSTADTAMYRGKSAKQAARPYP